VYDDVHILSFEDRMKVVMKKYSKKFVI